MGKGASSHWFYYVFVQKWWKTIGCIVFSLKNVEKPLVLLCFRSKILKKQWWYCVFAQKPLKNHWFYCVFAQKCWKTIGFIVFVLRNTHIICLIIQKRSSRYRCVSKIASPEALNNFTPETYRNARTQARTSQNP